MRVLKDIKIAIRSLFRFRSDAIINVIGLSIGITISIIVLLYVRNEINYDQHFSNSKNIYRVYTEGVIGDNYFKSAVTPNPLSDYLLNNFDEVTQSVKIVRGINKLVSYQDKKFNEDNFYYADTSFFNIFDIPLLKGDRSSLLKSDEDVVITRRIANKYFGNEEPIGKQIKLDNGLEFVVKGVCDDFPDNTHFHCDFIASHKSIDKLYKGKTEQEINELKSYWLQLDRYTYIVTADTTGLTQKIADQLAVVIQNQVSKYQNLEEGNVSGGIKSIGFKLQAIEDIHLKSNLENELESNSKRIYVVLFMTLALFVLVVTSINFMNLTTARASKRVLEIGVRKLAGEGRHDLFIQFIIEAVTYSFIALFLGLVLSELLLPGFNRLFNLELRINNLESRIDFLYVTSLTLLVGLISGLYPAISFSRYREVVIFKKGLLLGKKSMVIRGALAAGQVVVATFLVILTLGMFWNLKYLERKDLGFNSHNVMVVERGHALGSDFSSVKKQLKSMHGITDVSACKYIVGKEVPLQSFKYMSRGGEKMILLSYNFVEKDFLKTLQVNFSAGDMWDATNEKMSRDIVITAATKQALNMPKPLGKKINFVDAGKWDYGFSIVGVSKDFHFEPIQYPIRPLVLMELPKGTAYENLIIRISDKASLDEMVREISSFWKANTNGEPFEYKMLDDILNENLKEEHTVFKMVFLFAILSLFVAWLGIRAFSTYVTEMKMSEFQIKKIIGATHVQILYELFVEVGQFILTGIIIAIPISFFVLQLWLNGFAYYSRLPWFVMVAIGLVIFGLAFIIVLLHSIKTLKSTHGENAVEV
ncbi:ABC transporter permease [Plebeiibacterium sediminum]|uniref:ABC transporter permease n=1 Tax=Plebeiibacterium sediminum TaxID=2992112 RepID=A0AAE3SFV2_9BACT|nr:ABC transporter permease [Plebeiobacterium sediminum]MCW3787830.1 ABC transporter permease [Plebeiobacterium sediminum]